MHLALWLKKNRYRADQVQTFLPSPMATATAMYHTEINPLRGVRPGWERAGGRDQGAAAAAAAQGVPALPRSRELAAAARGAEGDGARGPVSGRGRISWCRSRSRWGRAGLAQRGRRSGRAACTGLRRRVCRRGSEGPLPTRVGRFPVDRSACLRSVLAYTESVRFFASRPKRSANIAKHGYDPAEFEVAFSFDRYLSRRTKPSPAGRERLAPDRNVVRPDRCHRHRLAARHRGVRPW